MNTPGSDSSFVRTKRPHKNTGLPSDEVNDARRLFSAGRFFPVSQFTWRVRPLTPGTKYAAHPPKRLRPHKRRPQAAFPQ